jgi:hypothetical protein
MSIILERKVVIHSRLSAPLSFKRLIYIYIYIYIYILKSDIRNFPVQFEQIDLGSPSVKVCYLLNPLNHEVGVTGFWKFIYYLTENTFNIHYKD